VLSIYTAPFLIDLNIPFSPNVTSLKSLSLSTPYELERKIGRLERILRVKTETDTTFTLLKEWIKKAIQIHKSI